MNYGPLPLFYFNFNVMSEEKIYYQKDNTPENKVKWIQGLNASGYAGITKEGTIVDRREFNDAIPIQKNSVFGIIEPKEL